MSNSKKIIIVVAALIIVGVLLYFLFRKPKAALADITQNPADIATAPAPIVATDAFPFKEGARGENVKRLQIALNRIGPQSKITPDGVFGPATRSKLYTTVSTKLSKMPMTYDQWLEIIILGNKA